MRVLGQNNTGGAPNAPPPSAYLGLSVYDGNTKQIVFLDIY